MSPSPARVVVVGGGIIGLAVADRLRADRPDADVTVLEKERAWARHQTGRNSGVIHSGLYYAPGSHKARMCRAGATSMAAFAEAEGVPYAICGKLVVATREDELPGLRRLLERGRANGLTVRELTPEQAREYEPHVRCVAALHVAETGIVDYVEVCRALARRLETGGATLSTGAELVAGHRWRGRNGATLLETTAGDIEADVVVNCAGLWSDVVARRLGHRTDVRIVPFRGEYHDLSPRAAQLVRGLVYPVPDPGFPFLGVHLTRGIDGHVHAGPNAVLALAREGYSWGTVHPREALQTLTFPGFWRLAAANWRPGGAEMARSLSRRRFAASVREILPDVGVDDLSPAPAGVRAQAMHRDGSLVDDFLIEGDDRIVHVLNAPSPAATSALEIARHVASLVRSGRDAA